jgi:septum formation protein
VSSPPRLILASASPRRHELLARLGVPFEIWPSAVEERLVPGVPATTLAAGLARAKGQDVAARARARGGGRSVVLGADTLVVLDGRAVGKPASRAEARRLLGALRDRAHEVVTAVAVIGVPDGREAATTVTSRVVMRAYSDAAIEAYVETGEADDKAGAYAAQGAGAGLIARIEGCFTNVVGLPLTSTARLLRAFGVPVRSP